MKSISYNDAGVNIDTATEIKSRIRTLAHNTFNSQVLSEIGGFGGIFKPHIENKQSFTLVASTDGVGTKLKIAFLTGIHNTIGYDLVAHCINDILVQGARPLFFLDYLATGKISVEIIASVVEGLTHGCAEANCPLIGGETAEMPGFYKDGEYDLAGFIVGYADQNNLINGSNILPGDIILGLPSVGLHTNGYSLARKLLFEVAGYTPSTYLSELDCTVSKELLKPHKSYLPHLDNLIDTKKIKGLAHITGGGIIENLPRILPNRCTAEITKNRWPILPIFDLLNSIGALTEMESYRTFNMGIGMIIIASPDNVEFIKNEINKGGLKVYNIGIIKEGDKTVELVNL